MGLLIVLLSLDYPDFPVFVPSDWSTQWVGFQERPPGVSSLERLVDRRRRLVNSVVTDQRFLEKYYLLEVLVGELGPSMSPCAGASARSRHIRKSH